MTQTRRILLPLLAAAVALSGCGGGGPATPRSKLENALAHDRGKTVCSDGPTGGSCKSFHAESATCATGGKLVGSVRFFRCRVLYDEGGRPDSVCAGMNGSKVVVRPKVWCKT